MMTTKVLTNNFLWPLSIGVIKILSSKDIFELRWCTDDCDIDIDFLTQKIIDGHVGGWSINYVIVMLIYQSYRVARNARSILLVDKTDYNFINKILDVSFISRKGFFVKVEKQGREKDFTVLTVKAITNNLELCEEVYNYIEV